MRYSEGFKRSIVKKAMDGSGRRLEDVASESGVHVATLGRWIHGYRTGTLDLGEGDGIQPSHRNPGEKLALLLESKTIGAEGMGEWLRHHGLHAEHLRLWEQEMASMANGTENKDKDEMARLRRENRELRKELEKKEKALAEVAVLLTLKKKHPTLFADSKDD